MQFGDNFVIGYNASSSSISPRIVAASSLSGGPLSFLLIKNGVSGFWDFTCPQNSNTCRWEPRPRCLIPRPTTIGRGEVWITNQYSGVADPSTTRANLAHLDRCRAAVNCLN